MTEQVTSTQEKVKRTRKAKQETTKQLAKRKLTLQEKQEINLKRQQTRQATRPEPRNRDRFYCTNKELHAELVKWRDSNKVEEDEQFDQYLKTHASEESQLNDPFEKYIDYTKRTISEELGKMLMAIADKLLNHSNFRNYTREIKEDARSFGFYKVIKGLKNYNFKFNNPFAWVTQAYWNAYITVIAKHYKDINLKHDLAIKLSQELETYVGINSASSLNRTIRGYIDNSQGN